MKRKLIVFISAMLCFITAFAMPVEAASTGYFNTYKDVSKISDRNGCTSMQGMAVGTKWLYTVKVNSSTNKNAFISKTNRETGATTVLKNSSTGSYYVDYLGHANDMAVTSIDGYSNLFVATLNATNHAVVRLKVDGSKFTKTANYTIKLNGTKTSVSGVNVLSKTSTKITFLFKKGTTFYTGSISTAKKSGTINLTKAFKINTSSVKINGKATDLSLYVHQGYGLYKNFIYVPLTHPTKHNISTVAVYKIKNSAGNLLTGTLTSKSNLSFKIKSSTYGNLCEIESCGISGDGKLYFNTNRRKTTSDYNHDGVHYFKNFAV